MWYEVSSLTSYFGDSVAFFFFGGTVEMRGVSSKRILSGWMANL